MSDLRRRNNQVALIKATGILKNLFVFPRHE